MTNKDIRQRLIRLEKLFSIEKKRINELKNSNDVFNDYDKTLVLEVLEDTQDSMEIALNSFIKSLH